VFEARNAQRTAALYNNTAITDDISFHHTSDVMLPATILRKHTDFAKNSISFLRDLLEDLSPNPKKEMLLDININTVRNLDTSTGWASAKLSI